VHVDNKRTENF